MILLTVSLTQRIRQSGIAGVGVPGRRGQHSWVITCAGPRPELAERVEQKDERGEMPPRHVLPCLTDLTSAVTDRVIEMITAEMCRTIKSR